MKFLLFVFVLFLFPLGLLADDESSNPCGSYPYGNEEEQKEWKKCIQTVNPLGGSYAHCNRYEGVEYNTCIETERMYQKSPESEPQPHCIENLGQNFVGGLGRNYEHQQSKSENLMTAAERRLETLKNCRQELRESWISFQEKKADQQQKRNLFPIKLRQAEIKYQRELNRVRRECRQKSNQEFLKYKEIVQGQGAIGPHQLHGFSNKINSHRHQFFKACYQAPENTRSMEIADKQLALNLDRARAEMKSVDDMVQSFSEQTQLVQDDLLRDCEKQKELNAYNEALTERNTSKASFMNKAKSFMEFGSSVGNCMGLLEGKGSLVPVDPDPTGSNSVRQ